MAQVELARLDRAIVEGAQRVRDQRALVYRLRRQGEDRIPARMVLLALEQALERLLEQRADSEPIRERCCGRAQPDPWSAEPT